MRVALAISRDLPELDQDEAPLLDALHERGVDAELAVWDDPVVDWSGYDAVVVRSTWDYTRQRERFLDWASQVEAVTTLHNPAEVLRWNTHKGYLIELEERGAPVVPTAWLGQGDRVDVGELIRARGWDEAVAKPAVGAGSRGLLRISPDRRELAQHHLDALLRVGDVMVQPLVRSVATHGELSVVLIDGEVTHAVRKRPSPGELRVQVEFGGRYEVEEPTEEVVGLARWVVEATGHALLYARVDLVDDESGNPQLAELEAAEPSLYLDRFPVAAGVLADAVIARSG